MRSVMLTEDYLMRLINQAIAALLYIVGLKQSGQYQEALQAIDQTLEQLIGLRADLIRRLEDRKLLDSLTLQGRLDTARLLLVADLFNEEADILARQNHPEESYWSQLRALNFYLEVFFNDGISRDAKLPEKIKAAAGMLDGRQLPLDTLVSLFSYHEQSNNYAGASRDLDLLLETPGGRSDLLDEARDFYRRLLDMPDEELDWGGISRDQVKQKLNDLR